MADAEPIDAVYMWVDDSFPGYLDLLGQYAGVAQDKSANRTRDNLDTLKYSIRSLRMYAPWLRNIFIVSCAPQKPRWLAEDVAGLTVIHHDAFMDAAMLPTFNSFAIQSCLHRIPGLSKRFLQFDDDVLLSAPVRPEDFADPSGRLRIFRRFRHTPSEDIRDQDGISRWNASLAHCNHLLNAAFGARARPTFTHAPLLIDRQWWEEMIAFWPEDFAHTRQSRFRAKRNVVPDYLYPHFLLGTARGINTSRLETYRTTFYFALEDYVFYTWWKYALLGALKPKTICLNDNFGASPNPRVVTQIRRFLERRYPVKSPFEL